MAEGIQRSILILILIFCSPGNERIPDNWYTRNVADPYDTPFLIADTLSMLVQHPEFASIGGNTGTVNSFTGIDPAGLTGGIFNVATLAYGNNLFCYALQLTVQETPDILSNLLLSVSSGINVLGPVMNKLMNKLGCPTLVNIDKTQFSKFPGYTNLKSDGTY